MSYWRRRYTNTADPYGCLRWALVGVFVAALLLGLTVLGLIRI